MGILIKVTGEIALCAQVAEALNTSTWSGSSTVITGRRLPKCDRESGRLCQGGSILIRVTMLCEEKCTKVLMRGLVRVANEQGDTSF